MKKINFKNLDLDLFYEKLDNGLEIFVLPKTNVNNIYVTFNTKYGSNISEFKPIDKNKMIKVPLGIAHFLEHKMFEQEDETDIFSFYSERGADCNANTNYTKTTYLFSCPNFFKENMDMLLDYVQAPYFTDENVDKEKGIITQEIKMYQDMPGTMIYDKIIENTFKIHPMKYPIIGNIENINKITKEDLYTCYNTFYHPSNMFVVVTGNVNASEVINIIKENQNKKKFKKEETIKIKSYNEPKEVDKEFDEIKLNVSIPKCAICYKLKIDKTIQNIFYLLTLFDCKFSSTSEFVHNLLEEKIINDNLAVDFDDSTDYTLMFVLGESSNPKKLIEKIKDEMKNLDISEKDFERKKKVLLSSIIYMTENIFSLNNNITSDIIRYGKFNDNKYNDIKNLNYKDFINFIKKIDFKNNSTLIINPKN